MRHLKLCLATLGVLCVTSAAYADVIINPNSLRGWRTARSGRTARAPRFRSGPDTPPCRKGSVELRVGKNGDDASQIQFRGLGKVRLDSLTSLVYHTFVADFHGPSAVAPYIILNVDNDGDGVIDDLLFFDPAAQNTFSEGGVDNVFDGAWQEWDARNGGWTSLLNPDYQGFAFFLDDYLFENPDATITNSPNNEFGPGLRIVAGFNEEFWTDFIGSVDCVTIGIDGVDELYDFELRRRR